METSKHNFGAPEFANTDQLIELACAEDLGDLGDITSKATIPAQAEGRAALVARAPGILCGLPVLQRVADRFQVFIEPPSNNAPQDGTAVSHGEILRHIKGPMRAILAFERTALNFLQRLSGIATQTHHFVQAVHGTHAAILDTRKTTPGWRILEKYAVRCGGGQNHRIGLYDAILIKDNHLAFLADHPDPIGAAVTRARKAYPNTSVEVEVTSLAQLERALACAPDLILLDNMTVETMTQAVARRNQSGKRIQLEASGGVNLQTVRAIAQTGVDRISVGALTHSVPALDLALDVELEKS